MQPDIAVPTDTERAPRPGEPEPASQLHTTALGELLARPPAAAQPQRANDIVIGMLCALGEDGQPLVAWPAGPDKPTPATSLAPVFPADVGRSVALAFPGGSEQPLILGFVWQPPLQASTPLHAEVDGEHLEVEARQSITLRCGQASITLTADGQVLLRGTYVSSHSSGTQRIKGAAVRIN